MRLFLVFLFFIPLSLVAEIDTVVVRWKQNGCVEECVEKLKQELVKLPAVKEVSVIPGARWVMSKWEKGYSIDYTKLAAIYKHAGLTIQDVRITVEGKIIQQEGTILMISPGDWTAFILYNAALPSRDPVIMQLNPESSKLEPTKMQKVPQEANKERLVTLRGVLMDPQSSPPFRLVVEQISWIH